MDRHSHQDPGCAPLTRHSRPGGRPCDGVGTPDHDSPPSLFDTPETAGRARVTDPEPSHQAGRRLAVGTQRRQILEAFDDQDVITADDMQDRHPQVHRSSWASRLAGMRRDGLVEDAGPVAKRSGVGGPQTVQSFRLARPAAGESPGGG